MVWQGNQPARGGGEVLRQASHASAGQDDDPLPRMEGVRLALHDHAGTLMAWAADLQRVMLLGVPGPIAMANVAAADRHPLELDEALAILDRRHVHLDELEELATDQLCRFHTSVFPPPIRVLLQKFPGARLPLNISSYYVTVHMGEPKSPCPTMLRVVRSEPYGRSGPLAARDMGAHAASRAGDDFGAGNGPRPAAGGSGAVEGDGRGVDAAAEASLAPLLPAALG